MGMLGRWAWATLALYWGALVVVTHMPLTNTGQLPGNDKAMHFVAYFGLAALLHVTFGLTWPRWRWAGIGALGVAMAYGAVDEWTQALVGRSCELADWLADVAGSVLGAGLVGWLRAIWSRRRVASPSEPTTIPV